MIKSVTVISGGMDSGVLAYYIKSQGWDQLLLSFDYGQRHNKELHYAAAMADKLGYDHKIVDLTSVTNMISTSALTMGAEVPDGHYNEDSMRTTVVPNRNAMMLAVAFAVGSSGNFHHVSTGVHSGDRYNYPDCRSEFINAFQIMQNRALEGFSLPLLYTPFIEKSKEDIARIGKMHDVPFHTTWSCYKGGRIHCGKCGTCVERLEALHRAGAVDKTEYQDTEYWKTAVNEYEFQKQNDSIPRSC